jgi:uncharacterized membrane protein YfcA
VESFAHLPPAFHYGWLAFTALLGGLINSVAGGGGFLVFPSLLNAGVLPIQANATGTVALWPGQFTSIVGYRKDLQANLRLVLPAGITALAGGTAGALVLLHHSQDSFLRIVPYLFLLGAALFAMSGPVSKWTRQRAERGGKIDHVYVVPMVAMLLPVCFYIGYFGAGAGLLTMTVLSFCGVTRIAEVNAVKVVITTIANGVAVLTFIFYGAVEWRYCWLMMLACGIGGYVGAHNARRIDDKVLRPIIVALGLCIAGYFFWRRP